MSWSVRLAQEKDASACTRIYFSDPNPLTRIMYPDGPTSALLAAHDSEMAKVIGSSDNLVVVAVKSPNLQEAGGYAKWRIFREPEDLSQPSSTSAGDGKNLSMIHDFKAELRKGRIQHCEGKKHLRIFYIERYALRTQPFS